MKDIKELEVQVQLREDIEAVKRVKAKYWRCVDRQLWDELAECFTEDALIDFGVNRISKGIVQVLKGFSSSQGASEHVCRFHHGHNSEIEIVNENKATAVWQLDHYRIDTRTNESVRLGAFYYDEYFKEGDSWKIKSSKLAPQFREKRIISSHLQR